MRKILLPLLMIFVIFLAGCSQATEPATEAPQVDTPEADVPEVDTPVPDTPEPEATEEKEPVELVYLVFETPVLTAEYWDAVIAEALSNLPDYITVTKIVSPGLDITTYAKQLLASDQFPDILANVRTQEFIDAGLLTPFPVDWIEENYEIPLGSAIGGKIWRPPSGAQITPFWFYNTDIFAEAGVQPPTTWAEFQDVVSKIDAAGFKPIQVIGAGDAWASNMVISSLISANVLGDTPDWVIMRKAGEVKFTDPDMASAWEKFGWLVENGYIDQGDLGVGYADANRAFIAGEVAMYPIGSWFLQQAAREAEFEPGVFLMPRDDGKIVVPFVVGGASHLSALSEHPEEALMFVQALDTSPFKLATLIEKDSLIPLLKGMSFEDYGVEVSDLMKEGMSFATMEGTTRVDSFSWTGNDNALIAGMVGEFNNSAQNVILGTGWQAELERLDQVWDTLAEE